MLFLSKLLILLVIIIIIIIIIIWFTWSLNLGHWMASWWVFALHPAVPTCLLLHHQGGGDLVSWAPVFSGTFWWEKYVKVWMELCIKTMSPRLETQWNTYIYNIIYIYYFYEKMWKVPAIPATFPRWFHMIHRFKSLRSDPIWFLRSESPWVWEHVFRWTTHGCLWPLARFLTTASAYIAYHAYHFQHMKVTIYHKMVY